MVILRNATHKVEDALSRQAAVALTFGNSSRGGLLYKVSICVE